MRKGEKIDLLFSFIFNYTNIKSVRHDFYFEIE